MRSTFNLHDAPIVLSIKTHQPFRRILAGTCTLVLLGGCVTWREQPKPLPSVRRTLDGPVRVTRRDGSIIVLREADERGDSVFGVSKAGQHSVAVPVDDVTRIQQRRPNVLANVALVTLAAATAFAVYVYSIFNDPNY